MLQDLKREKPKGKLRMTRRQYEMSRQKWEELVLTTRDEVVDALSLEHSTFLYVQ